MCVHLPLHGLAAERLHARVAAALLRKPHGAAHERHGPGGGLPLRDVRDAFSLRASMRQLGQLGGGRSAAGKGVRFRSCIRFRRIMLGESSRQFTSHQYDGY